MERQRCVFNRLQETVVQQHAIIRRHLRHDVRQFRRILPFTWCTRLTVNKSCPDSKKGLNSRDTEPRIHAPDPNSTPCYLLLRVSLHCLWLQDGNRTRVKYVLGGFYFLKGDALWRFQRKFRGFSWKIKDISHYAAVSLHECTNVGCLESGKLKRYKANLWETWEIINERINQSNRLNEPRTL